MGGIGIKAPIQKTYSLKALCVGISCFVIMLIVSLPIATGYSQLNNAQSSLHMDGYSVLLGKTSPQPTGYNSCRRTGIQMGVNYVRASIGLPFIHSEFETSSCVEWKLRSSNVAYVLDVLCAGAVSLAVGTFMYYLLRKRL